MAKKISEFNEIDNIEDIAEDDVLPVVNKGTTKKITIARLVEYLGIDSITEDDIDKVVNSI